MSANRLLQDVKLTLRRRIEANSNYRDQAWQIKTCARLFKRYDTSGNNQLDFNEFQVAMESVNIFDETKVKMLFDEFDLDG